ncbi:MAG: hypothetical protein M3Q47_12045, partial [Actinomycetota bacterium]|nr:hypothetical protein [Actinomycetota bacterium]
MTPPPTTTSVDAPGEPLVVDPLVRDVDRLTDRAELARLLDALPWLDGPDGAGAAVRLRWKPGTSVRIGAVVPTAAGPAAVLVAAFARAQLGQRGEGRQDRGRAGQQGAPVHRDGAVVAVPADVDPALCGLVPSGGVPLAYNPARRWVGRHCDRVVKVHAEAPPSGVAALLTSPPPALAAHLPAAEVLQEGRLVRLEFRPGSLLRAADVPAVAEALGELHRCPPPRDLPVLGMTPMLLAARNAARS